MITRVIAVVAALAACGKNEKPAGSSDTGSGKPVPAGSGAQTGDAGGAVTVAPADAATPTPTPPTASFPTPGPGSLVGKEPPTAESVHVEVSYAIARWHATPTDASIYAKDFGGRAEPDGRIEKVGYDKWLALLPKTPVKIQNPTIRTWLEPVPDGGSKLDDNVTRVNVSYWFDGKDEYRELHFRREGGKQLLISEQVNSRNSGELREMRNVTPTDSTALGKNVTARFGIEAPYAWLVVENDKGQQVITDLWPDARCTEEPKPADALALLRCPNGKGGSDFKLVHENDELKFRRTPINQAAPMSTERASRCIHNAKVTFAPTELQTR